MAGRKRQSGEGGGSTGAWIVTFCDCMTLLLCFFVLLLTFSSFEEVKLKKLAGAFEYRQYESIFREEREVPDSMMPPPEKPVHHTKEGSEKPTDEEPASISRPKNPLELRNTDAYKDLRVLRIPSDRMFLGRTTRLRSSGRASLDKLAQFLRRMPCKVIVSESSLSLSPGGTSLGLQRSVAIVRYLTLKRRIARGRFSTSSRPPDTPPSAHKGPVVAISLLSERTYQ